MKKTGEEPTSRYNFPLIRLLLLFWSSSPGSAIALILFSALRGILSLGQIYLYKLVIDATATCLKSSDPSGEFVYVIIYIVITGIVHLLVSASGTLENAVRLKFEPILTDTLLQEIHSKSVEVDLAYYENSNYRDTLHRAQQEAFYRPGRIVRSITGIMRDIIFLVGVVVLLFILHWSVALILFIALIPGIIARIVYSRILFRWERNKTQTERKARYFNWLLTSYPFAKEIRTFELGPYFIKQYNEIRQFLRNERFDINLSTPA